MTAVTPQGTPDPRADRPLWLPIVVVGIAGAVLGYLLGAAGTANDPVVGVDTTNTTVAADPAPTTTTTVTTTTTPDPTLSDLVPGFVGTLVAHVGAELAVWPSHRRSPTVTRIQPGTPFEPDASGVAAARLVQAATDPDHAYTVLQIGRARAPDSMHPAALDVRSFAWHASHPRLLAWIEGPSPGSSDPGLLRIGSVAADGMLVVDDSQPTFEVPPGAELIAWGDWGFLLRSRHREDEWSVILLEPEGAVAWRRPGYEAAQLSRSGEILLVSSVDGRVAYSRSDLSGRTPEPLGWEPGWDLSLDPDGRRVAHLVFDGGRASVAIRSLDGEPLHEVEFPGGRLWDVRWTPDGRFVLAPGEGSPYGLGHHVLLVLDTEDGSLHRVPFHSWVLYPRALTP